MLQSDSSGCFKQDLIGRNAAVAVYGCIDGVAVIDYVTDEDGNQMQFTGGLNQAASVLPATKEPESK